MLILIAWTALILFGVACFYAHDEGEPLIGVIFVGAGLLGIADHFFDFMRLSG